MAAPPRVGVGRSCTRRSSGFTTAPTRTATSRTSGMAANVTTVTMASTTAYAPSEGTAYATPNRWLVPLPLPLDPLPLSNLGR